MTDITDQIAAWSECKHFAPPHLRVKGLEARLRTADAIIERVADVSCACDLIGCEHDDARAYLAAREGER